MLLLWKFGLSNKDIIPDVFIKAPKAQNTFDLLRHYSTISGSQDTQGSAGVSLVDLCAAGDDVVPRSVDAKPPGDVCERWENKWGFYLRCCPEERHWISSCLQWSCQSWRPPVFSRCVQRPQAVKELGLLIVFSDPVGPGGSLFSSLQFICLL